MEEISTSAEPSGTPNPKFTLLIADDDDVGRKALFRLLEREGCRCFEARSGEEARQRLLDESIDLLVADIKMQGNTELELLKYLQENRPGLPVILITGHPTMETAVAATTFSAAAYLLKPLDPQKLVAAVRRELSFKTSLLRLHESLHRQQKNLDQMRQLETSLNQLGRKAETDLVTSYAAMAVNNAIESLLELKEMLKPALSRNRADLNDCFEHSRPATLIAALQEAIQVIDRTKNSFKSKELACLRMKLEGVVKEM